MYIFIKKIFKRLVKFENKNVERERERERASFGKRWSSRFVQLCLNHQSLDDLILCWEKKKRKARGGLRWSNHPCGVNSALLPPPICSLIFDCKHMMIIITTHTQHENKTTLSNINLLNHHLLLLIPTPPHTNYTYTHQTAQSPPPPFTCLCLSLPNSSPLSLLGSRDPLLTTYGYWL